MYNVYTIFVLKRTRVDKRRNGIVCIYLFILVYILKYPTYIINRNIYMYIGTAAHTTKYSRSV